MEILSKSLTHKYQKTFKSFLFVLFLFQKHILFKARVMLSQFSIAASKTTLQHSGFKQIFHFTHDCMPSMPPRWYLTSVVCIVNRTILLGPENYFEVYCSLWLGDWLSQWAKVKNPVHVGLWWASWTFSKNDGWVPGENCVCQLAESHVCHILLLRAGV